MADYGAWEGLGQAIGTGTDAFARARQAKLAATREKEQFDAEAKRQAEKDAADAAQRDFMNKAKTRELDILAGRNSQTGGLKLKPGERYNPQTDTVEAVPGSALYQEQANKFGKDSAALNALKQKGQGTTQAIDEFLGMKDGLESQFGGGYSGQLTRFLNPDAGTRLDNIKAGIRSAGLDMMRQGGSIGQMTEREWPMVEQLMANLSHNASEEEAKIQLEKVKAKIADIQSKAEALQTQEWGNTPFTQPMRTGRGTQQAPQTQSAPPAKRYKIVGVE